MGSDYSSDYGLIGGGLPSMAPFFWLFGIAMLVLLIGVGWSEYQESQTIYEMPDGIMCETKVMHGGGLFSGASTFEFRFCENGEKYINPEHFEEIRK